MKSAEKNILTALKPHANEKRAQHSVGYMNTRYAILGCNMPSIRAVAKEFSDIPIAELNATWKNSNTFDVLYVLLIIQSKRELTLQDWPRLKRWSTRIDNWAHSDTLSEIIARLLEQHPKQIYPDLKKWNTSKLPWQRRLSLTSLLYYSAMRSEYLPHNKILPLVKARLQDEHVYVQKAVGWTLRECGNVYPTVTKKFIRTHGTKLSAIAFSSATEKWNKREKEPLKQQRKLARKRS